jgi:hypothetical protein
VGSDAGEAHGGVEEISHESMRRKRKRKGEEVLEERRRISAG